MQFTRMPSLPWSMAIALVSPMIAALVHARGLLQAGDLRIAHGVVVDVGCGTGRRLRDASADLALGVDLSLEMLQRAFNTFQKTSDRPTLIIGFDENGIGKGSGRSIEGLPLVQIPMAFPALSSSG